MGGLNASTKEKEMIKLFLESTGAGAAGSTKLRWCVSKDVAEKTKGREVYLLIAVAAEGKRLNKQFALRQAVPLNAGLTHINFMYAGINRVFAKLYYGTKKEAERSLNEVWGYRCFSLNDGNADWEETSVSCETRRKELEARLAELPKPEEGQPDPDAAEREQLANDLQRCTGRLETIKEEEEIRGVSDPIHVPTDCFAKEWPTWLNDWVNWVDWSGRPLDECNRRRRALFSFTIQPIIVFFNLLFRFIAALFLGLLGTRKVGYDAVVRPIKNSVTDVWESASAPFWFPGQTRDSPVRLVFAPFCPLFIIISMIATHQIFGFGLHAIHWWILAAIAGVAAVEIVILLGVGGILLIGTYSHILNPFKWIAYFLSGGSPTVSAEDVARLECTGDCVPDPTKDRKTIMLWYKDVKARVCKPMQG